MRKSGQARQCSDRYLMQRRPELKCLPWSSRNRRRVLPRASDGQSSILLLFTYWNGYDWTPPTPPALISFDEASSIFEKRPCICSCQIVGTRSHFLGSANRRRVLPPAPNHSSGQLVTAPLLYHLPKVFCRTGVI